MARNSSLEAQEELTTSDMTLSQEMVPEDASLQVGTNTNSVVESVVEKKVMAKQESALPISLSMSFDDIHGYGALL